MTRAMTMLTILLITMLAEPASIDELRVLNVPFRVFKISDNSKFATESWTFSLVVQDEKQRNWTPVRADIELSAKGVVIKKSVFEQPLLETLKSQRYQLKQDTPAASPRRLFSMPEIFDLQFSFSEPQVSAIDKVKIILKLSGPDKVIAEKTLEVPVETYKPRTKLIFPFKGPAIVTQGHFNNGGHAHRNTLFAIDVMGLTPLYAPMLSEEEKNDAIAGYGRAIIAPADGKIVYARNDVPENTKMGEPNEAAYSALSEPAWAIGGNCVVIDHGNREFSVLMHMQFGSVTVKKGDTVKQGQPIGKLGNSGDSYMPHLHYHLQDGPIIFASDGLPLQFSNLPDVQFVRGNYFDPK